jgi:cytochrome b561
LSTELFDQSRGYGRVSRLLHWGMALLLLWQFISALLHYVYDDTPITDFFFGWHFTNGVLILALALLRGAWGLINLSRRPPHDTPIHRLAALGQLAMYALMVAVPVIALIRAWGSTRPFSAFGIELFAGQPEKIEWMANLGGQWHGLLGWTLFVLIGGHIVMAFVHTYWWREPVLQRMTRGRETR